MPAPSPALRFAASTPVLTVLALAAFAANSLLCRMALRDGLVDPVSFTQIRLGAGALALLPIVLVNRSVRPRFRLADWRPAAALFAYALAFSLAYVSLGVGAGALILFGTVQIAMIGLGLAKGDRPGLLGWLGLALAFGGLIYLVAPGLSAPPLVGAGLMAVAGLAWGLYSAMGKGEPDPVYATARNFVACLPLVAALTLATLGGRRLTAEGAALAIASGVLASGLGYVLWYRALRGLSHLAASVGQLAVPVLAALGAALWLGEPVSLRTGLASALILGGVLVATWPRRRSA
jgi:drug/metabolite transporter (DMT)-like permease